jgi:hypothetical protein
VGSLVLLGFGLWWLGLAILTTLRHAKTGIPFNLGWWGLTFPFGVFILAIFNLGHQIKLYFYNTSLWHSVFFISDVERGNEENLSRSIQWSTILLSMFGRFTTKNAVR